MSDPTYRIRTHHRPWEPPHLHWYADVERLSDEAHVHAVYRATEAEALTAASKWIAVQNQQQPGSVLFVDDDGRPVEGHSVKA